MQFVANWKWWFFTSVLVLIIIVIWLGNHDQTVPKVVTADIGTVTSFISVSGDIAVEDLIPLSFPVGGTVQNIFVERGDTVATGTILATVGDTTQQAEYAAARAEVARTQAVRDEIQNGQTAAEAAVTQTTVTNAEAALFDTIKTEAARVESARTTLYTSNLTAVALDPETEGAPPTITGSYTCTAEGTYELELYRSNTDSGYSYRYRGIETGTKVVSVTQAAPLGSCGLRIQFPATANYRNGEVFTIAIPNTASPTYANNRALYEEALVREETNIAAAKQALDLALDQGTVATAGARVEALVAANATVAAAEARLLQAESNLSDQVIRAPKSGVITDVLITPGETVTASPVMNLYTSHKTSFTASVPEKDIARIALNQPADITFDAKPDTTITGQVNFISPVPTITNGASFYEVAIILDTKPDWLRAGMQADVNIITDRLTDVVRIPRIYMQEGVVTIRTDDAIKTIVPEIRLRGTDGFIAISGIDADTEVTLPAE